MDGFLVSFFASHNSVYFIIFCYLFMKNNIFNWWKYQKILLNQMGNSLLLFKLTLYFMLQSYLWIIIIGLVYFQYFFQAWHKITVSLIVFANQNNLVIFISAVTLWIRICLNVWCSILRKLHNPLRPLHTHTNTHTHRHNNVWIQGRIRNGWFLRIFTVAFILFLDPVGGTH